MYLLTASQGHSRAPEYKDPADDTQGAFRGGMHFFKPTHTTELPNTDDILNALGVTIHD